LKNNELPWGAIGLCKDNVIYLGKVPLAFVKMWYIKGTKGKNMVVGRKGLRPYSSS